MSTISIKSKLAILIVCALAIAQAATLMALAFDGSTPSGTVITNRAEATYQDDDGSSYDAVSETVTVTVLAVSSITVTPDETQPSATVIPRDRVTRLFQICNSGNIADSYTVTQAAVNSPASLAGLYFDNDGSGTVTGADVAIVLKTTISNALASGRCLGVLAIVDVNDSPVNSNITIDLTARSTANGTTNGIVEDNGKIINTVAAETHLTSPDGSGVPTKTVNGSGQTVVSPGVPFTYEIAFRNSGDVDARDVVMNDDLPAQIDYVPGSLVMDNRALTDEADGDEGTVQGRRITVQLARVTPAQVVHVSFRARLATIPPGGVGIINIANFTGSNIPPVNSTTAVVLVDPFGTVFAGRGGASTPIPGAQVTMLVDQDGNPLGIPPGVGFPPNLQNENPFFSDGAGHFSFALLPEQLGTSTTPVRYFLRVTATGYTSRMLEITIQPATAGLFELHVHALDAQPLAIAGGFELVNDDVIIDDMASVALNVPMFEPHGLSIIKSADRQRVEIGDAVTYRVEIQNPTAAAVTNVIVRDRLPVSFHYVSGTGRLTVGSTADIAIEPQSVGEELAFQIGDIPAGATARLLYRVRIGANASDGDQDNLAVASGDFPNGQHDQTAPARATVTVGGGVFSTRQIIVGRVFVDTNRDGMFDAADRPMPGARLFLTNGQSVVTDSAGLYNFPSLGEGPQVISLDPISIPPGYALTDGGTLAGRSWTRLLRTPVGGGALLRQNFAFITTEDSRHNIQPRTTGDQAAPSVPASDTAQLAAGSYEVAATESIEPVAPGEVRFVSPNANSVVMAVAMEVDVRVALNWKTKVDVNGKMISEQSIGTSRLDRKNNVSTFSYVGIDVRPGPNRVRATAISPEGTPGRSIEMVVLGRGPARRLEIAADKAEVQANGRDAAILRVRALDQWGNPALGDQVALQTSAGELQLIGSEARQSERAQSNNRGSVTIPLVNGEAVVRLVAAGAPGQAHLHAQLGETEAESFVRITPESRPGILVGMAELTLGQSPEISLRGEQDRYRARASFFFSGRIWKNNLLTLAYDTERPINRTAGRDRLFQLDPLERVYPLFGDSSTRYEAAASNSKLYARIDHNRSFAAFGDFEADLQDAALIGYSRKLTGVKLHLENSEGSFVTFSGARPDTSFARDVFPAGGLGLLRLSHREILPGSETIVLEVRDRRNPEVIISRETLARGVDYNLNPLTGELFLLRYISTFDFGFNLAQLVVTYEHRADSLSSGVYTARAKKNFARFGLRLGFAGVVQRQEDTRSFVLGGIDGEKILPRRGLLRFAIARSHGEFAGSGNAIDSNNNEHNGGAYQLELNQPIGSHEGVVRARYSFASPDFFNPFGASVTPGSRRGEVSFEFKPRADAMLHFGLSDERNHTASVNNSRFTMSAAWDQTFKDRVRLHFGYDHRSFSDEVAGTQTDSNLVTLGADVKVTSKLQLGIRREQNLGDADPTYPNQTTLAATYQVDQRTKVFMTQRLASAAIIPIADFANSTGGFASTGSRHETAVGIETRFGKYTAMTGRYQIENGSNGADTFAVIGLQNRLPINKKLSLELGLEHGFHLAGVSQSFNGATVGFGWQPNDNFRAFGRYEFRDRAGTGQLISLGAAGRIREGVTVLSRLQIARTGFDGRRGESMEGMAALAIRPLTSDRAGLLFSFNHRSTTQAAGGSSPISNRDRIDSLSTDGYYQATKRLELYGRVALRLSANGQASLPFVSTISYLTQARAQYRLTRRIDWANEMRMIIQPSSHTQRSVFGTEIGYWVMPDLRVGGGYNFTVAGEPADSRGVPVHRGFYFTVSSKLSRLFDLFGTPKTGLAGSDDNASAGGKR